MATRDIYETSFDEDVQTESNVNQCPECSGRVTTIQSKLSVRTVGSLLTNNESTAVRNGELTTNTSENERALH